MPLEVIGTGLGRTGTKSLQTALAQLGFGPCHHMVEVFAHRETMPLWIDAADGRADWDLIFANYRSAVDYPSAAYWRELTAHYPHAKVVHTVRDPDDWFESTQATIFRPGGFADTAMTKEDVFGAFFRSFVRPLRDHLHDRDFLIDYFRRHTEEVKAAIPAERLLIYRVSEGWPPLCNFLGVPEPGAAPPLENTRAEFIARVSSAEQGARPQ
jgi:hypothetical protein